MIISVSGKIESGKDTVGKIINYLTLQYLSDNPQYEFIDYCEDLDNNQEHIGKFEIKKFADKLKDIVCLLIGCTREQLEDAEFKNTELGEEWWKYRGKHTNPKGLSFDTVYFSSREEVETVVSNWKIKYHSEDVYGIELIKTTPRLLLQLLGTECGRDIIHPNIWVNSLMSEYKALNYNQCIVSEGLVSPIFPNWIITDTRFPNELEAINKRCGISIRVNRIYSKIPINIPGEECNGLTRQDFEDARPLHASETALDNATFDYTIDNNGNIEELIEKVKEVLIKENII